MSNKVADQPVHSRRLVCSFCILSLYSVVLYLRHIEFQDSDYQGGFKNFPSGGGRCVCVCVGAGSKTIKSDGFIVVNLFYRAVLSQSFPVFYGINNY